MHDEWLHVNVHVEIILRFTHTPGRDAMEVAREIVATITDPSAMVGPEVCAMIFHSFNYTIVIPYHAENQSPSNSVLDMSQTVEGA